MIPTLFIGGPWDGRREAVREGEKYIQVPERLPHTGTWAAAEFLKPEMTLRTHDYRVHGLNSRVSIALHESLSGRDPFEILIERYPAPLKVY